MSDSRPSTADEKATVATAAQGAKSKAGFFSRMKKAPKIVDGEVLPEIPESEAEKITPVPFFSLFRFSTKFELFLNLIGLICAAAGGAAQPLMSLLFGNLTQQFVNFSVVVNRAKGGDPAAISAVPAAAAAFRKTAAQDASYLVYIGVGILVCTYIYMYIWVYTAEVNAKRLRERYLQAVLRQDIQFFDKVGAGEVATRIQTDTHLVQQGISEKVALAVSFTAAFVTGFVLAYVRNWRLALALTSMLPCIMIIAGLMYAALTKYIQLSLKHVAEGGSLAEEVISTVRTAQAFGTQHILSSLYNAHILRSRRVDLRSAIWSGGGMCSFFFVIYSGYALAFSFGTTLINSGHATPGEVVNVFLAILVGSISLAQLTPQMEAITRGRGAAAKLFATIDRVPTIDSADSAGQKPKTVTGEITLEHVKFSYPSRPTVQVLGGLSITFRAGKTAALVGASGSGKSTIIALTERFYDPTSGVVKFDGIDLKDLNLKWLRSQIGLVSQEPTLFATTIRGNVAHGLIGTTHEHASEEEKFALIEEACVKANAHNFIMNLPNGYDTMVGERGFLLSGGQKQRVAIARAIVSDPRVLLLDEATSALDTQSEGIVQDALDKASEGRTTIAIAHRLSTVKDADVIYVMGDGLVLEEGSHAELLARGGAYHRLVQAQKLRERTPADDRLWASGEKGDKPDSTHDEIPLGRKYTGHSLASDIIEKRRHASERTTKDGGHHSLFDVFIRIAEINREVWSSYVLGGVCAMLTGTVYPAFGVVFAKGITGFSASTDQERRLQGDRNALWFFLIAILSTLAVGVQNYLFSTAAAMLTAKLRMLSFHAILRQDIEFFDKDENSTGNLTSTLSDNPQKVNGLAGVTLATIVQSISTLVTGWVIGLVFGWKLALVGIACAPLLVSAGYIRLRVVVLKDEANKKAHENSAHLACEAAGAIRTVAALTREDDCCDLYRGSLEEPLRNSNRSAIWSNALYAFSQAMQFFVIGLVFWYGAILVSRQEYSNFQFFVCLMSTTFGSIQAGSFSSFVPDISSAKSAGTDIINLVDAVPEIDTESTEGKLIDSDKIEGHIRFENVHFRYPTRPGVRVLRGLSLEAKPGTYVALVGASGCGKSTVIQLIERFYDPLSGQVFLDGQPISELNVQEYRKQIALVSQEPTLYAGTIRFNILLGATKPEHEITQDEVEKACCDANILEFIQGLPDGFETEVGGKGSQLSGGQKQRIAIARALLRNPKVLLLDEATSALDGASEKIVQVALDQAAKGRTTIAIAHRLSTIQNADHIYFIKEGQVSEHGTHDQLLQRRGDYYEYVQLQALTK